MRTVSTFVTGRTPLSPAESIQRSTWHSPAPYLFIGLSAMLGLISFALLTLAYSCWRNSGENGGDAGDVESGGAGEKNAGDVLKFETDLEEKIVVIMAGDLNPSYFATPVWMNICKFGDENGKVEKKLEMERGELSDEKVREEVIRDQNHEESHCARNNICI
ncbi:protein GLUTAMINE DUMPER 5 [Capsicum galapagoense]